MSDAKGLAAIAGKLKEVVGDLQSLEVLTFSGDVKLVYKKEGQGDNTKINFDWSQIATSATEADVDMNLMLATKVEIDGDSTHFVTKGEIPEFILKTHVDAVKAGSEYRSQVINFLAGKVAGILS